jgi:hypothetical protein
MAHRMGTDLVVVTDAWADHKEAWLDQMMRFLAALPSGDVLLRNLDNGTSLEITMGSVTVSVS